MALENKNLQKWWDTFVTLQENVRKTVLQFLNIFFASFHCFKLSLREMNN